MAMNGLNTFNNASTGKDNEFTVDMKKLLERIDTLETTNHAMWLMLKSKGYTDEEFDTAMMTADSLRSERFAVGGLRCPNCGKSAQLSKQYKIKCIYCGSDAILHPFEVFDIAKAQAESEAMQQNQQEVPYDINQDLRFDEY